MMAEKLKEAARVADEDAPVEQGDSQLLGMSYYHLYFYRVVGFFWLVVCADRIDKLRWGISRNCVVIIPPSRSSLSLLVLWDCCLRLPRHFRIRFLLVLRAWFGYGCICMLDLHTWGILG